MGECVGERKNCALIQSIEHQEDSMVGKWEALGATGHSKDCQGRFIWLQLKMLAKLSNMHERKKRESLEINSLEKKEEYNKSVKMLNRGRVNTNSWKPLFHRINMARHANVMK